MRCDASPRMCTDDTRAAAASAIEDIDVAIAEINSLVAARPPTPSWRSATGSSRRHGRRRAADDQSPHRYRRRGHRTVHQRADSPQLRACHAPGCVLYFLKDHPRREWCSTACGNRARAARHYRRHRLDARADST